MVQSAEKQAAGWNTASTKTWGYRLLYVLKGSGIADEIMALRARHKHLTQINIWNNPSIWKEGLMPLWPLGHLLQMVRDTTQLHRDIKWPQRQNNCKEKRIYQKDTQNSCKEKQIYHKDHKNTQHQIYITTGTQNNHTQTQHDQIFSKHMCVYMLSSNRTLGSYMSHFLMEHQGFVHCFDLTTLFRNSELLTFNYFCSVAAPSVNEK